MVNESTPPVRHNRITPQKCESNGDSSETVTDFLTIGRFDWISVTFLLMPILLLPFALANYQPIDIANKLASISSEPLNYVAMYSAVFSFLAIRQMIKNRESGANPTLFVDVEDENRFQVLNLGNGPAHSLDVDSVLESGDSSDSPSKHVLENIEQDAIIRVDEALDLGVSVEDLKEAKSDWEQVTFRFEYSTNLGTDMGPVERTIQWKYLVCDEKQGPQD